MTILLFDSMVLITSKYLIEMELYSIYIFLMTGFFLVLEI